MSVTRVAVTAERSYDVLIGHDLAGELPGLIGAGTRRVLVVHQGALAGPAERIRAALTGAGYEVHLSEVPDGEDAKTATVAARCWEQLGLAGFTRDDVVIGLGGGAATDLAGFVAATWLRGVRVIQVPTTLLGMVDAAVGGKTGINTAEGKNLVGSFHSPIGVLCDLDALETLPAADLAAGLAEVVKCGFIDDPRILELVEADPDAARDPSAPVVRELVERAVATKARVVSADLREADLREILNYGHTFAHAIEHHEHFRWRHGEAVSVGLVFAAELARLAGHLEGGIVDRHRRILTSLGLPTSYPTGSWDDLLTAMRRDKKTRGATLRFVILDGLASPTRLEGPSEDLLLAAYVAVSAEPALLVPQPEVSARPAPSTDEPPELL
ncbi:3-dehydroquinate synthase [Occultella aeris]|uniref:3-dehydroquinate synthase n=1 Tax=Occultella aeris TaxID=2761496 RepID=A0A7M4DSW7_9MICO|nr:3-dehydroquinate synthase [Occultella aeris]VZO40561.1 3-dehydroquinate synthase [Occultella aeris]